MRVPSEYGQLSAVEGAPTLKRLQVIGLLGHFNHDVDLFRGSNFSLLYGPNGVGKTKLLELVAAIFRFRLGEIAKVPFHSIILTFDDETMLTVTSDYFFRSSREESNVEFSIAPFAQSATNWSSSPTEIPREELEELIEANIDGIRRLDENRWRDVRGPRIYTTQQVVDAHLDELPIEARGLDLIPSIARDFFLSLNVHLIETQRLLINEEDSPHRLRRIRVAQYARDLRSRFNRAMSENSRESQRLDRSFPGRVLRGPEGPDITDSAIFAKYSEQLAFRTRLSDLDLVDRSAEVDLPSRDLGEWDRAFLWIYLDDTEKKLAPFHDLVTRLDALQAIINSRFLYKEIKFNGDRGFYFEGPDGLSIFPSDLSSGEQHELVVFYDLLFNVSAGTLVLIDEPEISLHVNWQRRFMHDIDDISNITRTKFIVATHSPQIINQWDKQAVALTPFDEVEG